jgi:hypothetical protein
LAASHDVVEQAKRTLAGIASDDVLRALNVLFPDRCPPLDWSMDRIRYAAGQRSVVDFLEALQGEPVQDSTVDLEI